MSTDNPGIAVTLSADELALHGAWLRRLAATLAATEQDAEDLVQETWRAALGGRPRSAEQLRPWLAGVLRRQAVMLWRSGARRAEREEASARAEALPSTEELAGRADRGRELTRLVLELPEASKRVVLLHFFEGLSCAEIARRLDRPAGTVRSQLSRALAELRDRLDAETEGGRQEWLSGLAALPIGVGRGGLLVFASKGLIAGAAAVVATIVLAVILNRPPGAGGGGAPESVAAADAEPARDPVVAEPVIETEAEVASRVETPPQRRAAVVPEAPAAAPGAAPSAPVGGRVLDPTRGEPVPALTLALRPTDAADDAEPIELLVTDADGRFVSEGEHEPGSYRLDLLEERWRSELGLKGHPSPQARGPLPLEHRVDAEGGAAPAELELEVGPLFEIALSGGDDSSPLAAILTRTDRILEPGWSEPAAVVRGATVRARFAPLSTSVRRAATHLHVLSVDGRWAGSTPIELVDTAGPQSIAVELEPTGPIRIDVSTSRPPDPTLVAAQAWLGARTTDAIDVVSPLVYAVRFSSSGSGIGAIDLDWVPTGQITVAVEGMDCEPYLEVIEHTQDGTDIAALLERVGGGDHFVEGTVVYRGEDPPDFELQVYCDTVDRRSPAPEIRRLAFARDGDAWSAPFRLENLDARPRYLQIGEAVGFALPTIETTTLPERHEVTPGESGAVSFELLPIPPARLVRVRAIGTEDGQPLEDFECRLTSDDGVMAAERATAVDGVVEIEVRSDGEIAGLFATARGRATRSLSVDLTGDGGEAIEVVVELSEGWGAPLFVDDGATGEALAGVAISIDGVPAGTTDADGMFALSAPARPERIGVELDGYSVADSAGPVFRSGRLKRAPGDQFSELYYFTLERE